MDSKIYKQEEYKTSKWTGGTTTQLAIFPENSSYLDRTFLWRLSSAVCAQDESVFSKLPDYDRTLVVLKGNVILAHEGQRTARLAELEQDSFDGAWKTTSFGQITDYNLMVRKGNLGSTEVLTLSQENRELQPEEHPEFSMITQAFYVTDGYLAVDLNGRMKMVQAGEQFVLNYEQGEQVRLQVMGEGHAVWCQVFYNFVSGEFGPTEVESRPASFSDFRECVFIANTQYRFSKYTNKRLKNLWYDEALQAGIRKINRFYLADLAFLAGLMVIMIVGVDRFSGAMWGISILVWIFVWMFLAGPFIYFLAVPKPVSAHMKKLDELTPYEQKLREAELNRNERVEKILNRYKFSGTDTYDEEGNRTDDYYAKKI